MQEDLYETHRQTTLLDILDRVLNKGVVISGDIIISVADIELVYVGLRVLLSSVETMGRLDAKRVIPVAGNDVAPDHIKPAS